MGAWGLRLEHVMVVGGTPKDWDDIGADEWEVVVDRLGAVAAAAGARWLTIRPYGPHPASSRPRDAARTSTERTLHRHHRRGGRRSRGVRRCRGGGAAGELVDEQAIARQLYAPADVEPDLIVILGPHDRLPPSLVWELAYGELVFVDRDLPTELSGADLQRPSTTFHGRSRRFGRLDSDS